MKICLVCSSGGHFFELYSLATFWERHDHFWVTFPSADTNCLLKNEKRYDAFYPTTRNIINFVKNIFLAAKILSSEKPDMILSTGAGVGVPFIFIGRALNIKIIYIESLTFIDRLSLTGKLVYLFADHFLVQWPELTKKYKKAVFAGTVI